MDGWMSEWMDRPIGGWMDRLVWMDIVAGEFVYLS